MSRPKKAHTKIGREQFNYCIVPTAKEGFVKAARIKGMDIKELLEEIGHSLWEEFKGRI